MAYATQNTASLGVGLLFLVLVGKMITVTLSQEVGFLGGTVFPVLFIGGTAGIVIHLLLPDIPNCACRGGDDCCGARRDHRSPRQLHLDRSWRCRAGGNRCRPIGIAVVTAHLTVGAVKVFAETRESM